MKENIKIGLIAIIAATVVIDTFFMGENAPSSSSHSHSEKTVAATTVNTPSSNIAANNPVSSNIAATPAEPPKPTSPPTSIKFEKEEHDFGKVKQDTENKYKFKFKNTGSNPLIIENAFGSCGCTVPTYPKEPIPPGSTGEIEVVYSPGKQKGMQQKTVTVIANTEPKETRVQIKADVQEIPEAK